MNAAVIDIKARRTNAAEQRDIERIMRIRCIARELETKDARNYVFLGLNAFVLSTQGQDAMENCIKQGDR